MKEKLIDFYTGAPIIPEDLWYREEFINNLWDILERHHALLSAPRRTGKTSVMDYLAVNSEKGFSCIPVFVQDLDHPSEFILTLLDAFHDRHPKLFRQVFTRSSRLVSKVLGKIKSIGAGGFKVGLRSADPDWKVNWKKHGDDFLDQVRVTGNRILFLVDEFPDMILNMNKSHPEQVRSFLAWFRGHRQLPHPKNDPVRWLLGGSVNLSSTLDALDCLDKINDIHEESLPPLTPNQIKDFVTRMLEARQVEIDPKLPAEIATRFGQPVPVFLQMITQDLHRIYRRRPHRLTVKDLQQSFDDLIVSSAARDKLQHYYSRIGRYYETPKEEAAYAILALLSVSNEGESKKILKQVFDRILQDSGFNAPKYRRDQLFSQLLFNLENDFYVVETVKPNRYDFASGLLKAWWRKYYA